MEAKSKHEQKLVQELLKYKINDSFPDPYFDDFAQLAISIASVQSVVIFFGGENQLIKAIAGNATFTEGKTNLICRLVAQKDVYTEIDDLLRYDQFKFSAVLLENPVVRFIGKVPIFSKREMILGSICLMDERPRKMTADQIRQLTILSRLITNHLQCMKSQA